MTVPSLPSHLHQSINAFLDFTAPTAATQTTPQQQPRRRVSAVQPPVATDDALRSFSPADVSVLQASDAASPGAVVRDNFLGHSLATAAAAAARHMQADGMLRPAGMGQGSVTWHDRNSRGDHIMWVTDSLTSNSSSNSSGATSVGATPSNSTAAPAPELRIVLERMAELGAELRRSCPSLQLADRTSVQLAWYPGDGTGYVKHLDSGRASSGSTAEELKKSRRKVTALYYLNPDWCVRDGGQLRLFLRPDAVSTRADGAKIWDIAPTLDKLVIFRSDLVEHEVSHDRHVHLSEGPRICLYAAHEKHAKRHCCPLLSLTLSRTGLAGLRAKACTDHVVLQ